VNIKEYISSGIVESYVLGLASDHERAEFENLCARFPELLTARNDFELLLENQALNSASHAPESSRERFADFLKEQGAEHKAPVVSFQTRSNAGRRSAGFSWLAAASVFFVLVTGYFAYRYYNETLHLKAELLETREAQAGLDDRIKSLEEHEKMMKDPNVAVVSLTPMQKKSPASADIYWDSTSSNVFLVVKNMPKLPTDKQYQLWALIDGKPKDLGLFDVQNDNKVMLKMNSTQKADAFAITIENRGNTGGPTLEQLQTMGKTKL